MAHAHVGHPGAGRSGKLVREEGDDAVLDRQKSLLHGETDGGGREALAQRVEDVRGIGMERFPVGFRDDCTVADQLEGMQAEILAFDSIQERQEGRFRNAGVAGADPWQFALHGDSFSREASTPCAVGMILAPCDAYRHGIESLQKTRLILQ